MVLADKFVYVHLPKTGGTFVTSMLKQIHAHQGHQNKFTRFLGFLTGNMAGGILDTGTYQFYGHAHSPCRHIPLPFRNKPIFSTMRNPYNILVSLYEYGWWKSYPQDWFFNPHEIPQKFPNWPNLSFAEFIQVVDAFGQFKQIPTPKLSPDAPLGNLSFRLIKFFFKQPIETIFAKIDEDYISSKKFLDDMFPIEFLKTENLNQDLYNYFSKLGYDPQKLAVIQQTGEILPPLPEKGSVRQERKWEKYYTPELKSWVRKTERLVFTMFPEYDV